MKKLLNKKVLGAVLALLLALGVCDLTVMEQSHLKPVLQDLQKSATSLFDDEAEEAPKTLIQGSEAPAKAE
jgi:hypothetical protein